MANIVGSNVNEAPKNLSLFKLNSFTECICCQKNSTRTNSGVTSTQDSSENYTITTRRNYHQSTDKLCNSSDPSNDHEKQNLNHCKQISPNSHKQKC
jgi:hypothetical protein